MNLDLILTRTATQLQQNWGVQLDASNDFEQLKQALVAQLSWMLEHDLERLVQAMYRLDVPEKAFHAAMAAPNQQLRAQELALSVLAREQKRAETWLKYSAPTGESHD